MQANRSFDNKLTPYRPHYLNNIYAIWFGAVEFFNFSRWLDVFDRLMN